MKYIDLTLKTPAENLACDEALLDWCEATNPGEVLRFWEPDQSFVVVGYANRIATEVNLTACQLHKVPVLRRCSGGGTVLQGAGCLNYSLILKIEEAGPLNSINTTNQYILERHCEAMSALTGQSVELRGSTDLAIGERKFSGNSQRRKRSHLLFHGTFLLQFELALVETFLAMPAKQPGYRRHRPHVDFLINLNVSTASVKSALQKAWNAVAPLKAFPAESTTTLTREKYSTAEWNSKF